jgi:hypothetical protein
MSDTIEDAKLRHPSSGQLQEIIATSTGRAYNSGYLAGAYDERLRILDIADAYKGKPDFTLANLRSLIQQEQK